MKPVPRASFPIATTLTLTYIISHDFSVWVEKKTFRNSFHWHVVNFFREHPPYKFVCGIYSNRHACILDITK